MHTPAIKLFFATALGVVSIIALPQRGAADEVDWEPPRTWVIIVGVLEWRQSGIYHGFPKTGRRDARLAELFRKRGVPGEQLVFLEDRQATRKNVRATLDSLLPRTNPGDLLVFYYAGHGLRSGGTAYFANYDITGDTANTGLSVTSVVETIEQKFRGSHVLLAADCCHSGALGFEAKKHRGRISYAALTSTQMNSLSTGHWTFTECLLSGFQGDPVVDLNADGTVTLEELSRYTAEEMAFAEGQLASFTTSQAFHTKLKLSAVSQSLPGRVETRLEAEWKGSWWPARVLEKSEGRTKIHYAGFGAEWDEWISADRIRHWHPQAFQKGADVEVLWQEKWWPATIKESRLGVHSIEYTGFGHEWDEWVGPKRIRRP